MSDMIYEVADTLLRSVTPEDTIMILQPKSSFFAMSITFGDILTLIGMIGSVGVFWWQLYKTRQERRENLRSTWFLDVIVQPNMSMINDFYDKIITSVDEKITLLSKSYNEGGAAKELNKKLAQYQRDVKNEIKFSLGHFQSLLKASEPKISNDIDGVLDYLVDIATNYLDGYEDYDGSSVKVQALNNKQQFVSKLYSGWNE